MKNFLNHFKTAFIFTIAMLVLCGLIYPLALTGASQLIFPKQANGSKLEVDGKVVGAKFVGQDFTDERLFHCRPSAYNYNTYTEEQKENGEYSGVASGSNNYAPSNPELEKRIAEYVEKFMKENPTVKKEDIPSDIVTASGSGLDPHISVEAANVQIDRVVKNSKLPKEKVEELIKNNTDGKVFGIFGEDKVNVVTLNLELAQEIGMM